MSDTDSFKSGMAGGMYETETQRLQREADEFTKKVEHERRRLLILEDQFSGATSEFKEKKGNIQEIMPSTEEKNKMVELVKSYE